MNLVTVGSTTPDGVVPNSPVVTPLEMLQSAVQRGVDADTLQKFMDLHDRWQKDHARAAFNQAVAAFKANPPDVVKDMENKQYSKGDKKAMYTSLANLVNTVNRALAAHSLTARWTHEQETTGIIGVTCILSHAAGHSEKVTLIGPPDDSGAKNKLQQIKSTLTYLKAATFEAVTGIASRDANEDDDGNSAGKPELPPKIGPKRMRKIVEGLLQATEKQDSTWLLQVWDELENDEKEVVWRELRSWERSAIKKELEAAKAKDCGIQLDKLSESNLRGCKDLDALTEAMAKVTDAYAENSLEVPGDLQSLYHDLRAELKAK